MTEGSKKNVFSVILPCLLSLGLLTWVFMTTNYKDIWQAIKDSDMRYMTTAGIIFFLINFLIIWRWRILMKAVGLKAKSLSSMRWFFISLFSNLAPISTVGSDVIRGLGLAQELGHKPKIFASIVLDRLSGFAGIVILAAIAFLFGHGIITNKLVIIAIASLSIVSGMVVVVLFSHRVFSFACRAFAAWPKVKDNLMRLHYDIVLLKGKQTKGWEAIFISIGAQVVLAVEFYLSAKGMHQNIPLAYFVIFSPIVCVVTSLPSVAGLGFREISWGFLLHLVGVSPDIAKGLGLINSAFTIITGLLGGLFYVTTLSSGRVQYPQADPGIQRSPS
jgi:glycosyltransferase 2 family protein